MTQLEKIELSEIAYKNAVQEIAYSVMYSNHPDQLDDYTKGLIAKAEALRETWYELVWSFEK